MALSDKPSADEVKLNRELARIAPEERKPIVKALRSLPTLSYSDIAKAVSLPQEFVDRAALVEEKVSFEEFMEIMGITKEFVVSALLADILAKPGGRTKELKLLAQIKNMISEAKVTVNNNNFSEDIDSIRDILAGKDTIDVDIIEENDYVDD